jgi:hypothetical protein
MGFHHLAGTGTGHQQIIAAVTFGAALGQQRQKMTLGGGTAIRTANDNGCHGKLLFGYKYLSQDLHAARTIKLWGKKFPNAVAENGFSKHGYKSKTIVKITIIERITKELLRHANEVTNL